MVATDELMLLPLNADFTSFYTSFFLHGKELTFTFCNVPPPLDSGKSSLENVKIQCDSEIRNLLAGYDAILQQRLDESVDLSTFVLELKDILEGISFAYSERSLPPSKFYESLYHEMDSIGWHNLAWVGEDLNQINLRIFDEAGREHIVEVILPAGYPKVQPMASADLPHTVEFEWRDGSNIKFLLEQYKEVIHKYQDFWAVMEDVDKKFWIMEPEHPSRANVFRRIALGGHRSLSLTVDPSAPRSIPECRFFGSDMAVAPLRKKLNNNIRKWSMDRYLTDNLMEVLEMVFPSRQDTAHEDISVGCGICYAFRLSDDDPTNNNFGKEGIVPDRACDNGNCGKPFHTNCLAEWLRSISTTRQSFDVLFGNCPYCSHPIAVKVTST